MSSAASTDVKRRHAASLSGDAAGGLDVGWLLRSKKDPANSKIAPASTINPTAIHSRPQAEPTPPQSPIDVVSKELQNPGPVLAERTNDVSNAQKTVPSATGKTPLSQEPAPAPVPQPHQAPSRSAAPQSSSNNENKSATPKGPISNVKSQGGRRSSWLGSLSSKFSSSSPSASRNTSSDAAPIPPPSGSKSPKVEFGNPFNKKDTKQETKKDKDEKVVITHTAPQPRRQSVLVHAGQETKLDNSSFLSSALRRLSSSNNVSLGKGAGTGAIQPRKVMNIDHNRERVRLKDFDQNKLKRVAFCVDVEIAGYGVQADEQDDPASRAQQPGVGQRQSLASLERVANQKKHDTKYKDKGEGAALKNPQAATMEKEERGETTADTHASIEAERHAVMRAESQNKASEPSAPGTSEDQNDSQPIPSTRKKEKKKRSEEERKARREKKRRHAEANGLVPLELTRDDDDSDSSPNNTPPGALTPNMKPSDQPTTNPLRIYKRCCQLRETNALDRVKEQISKPASTLAESPGTVALLDLSGASMPLQDVMTLGDWLAVVPVRKLILDDCDLTDEALRIILSGLTGCKSADQAKHNRKLPAKGSGKRGQEQLGMIEKLSLKNNSQITHLGWKHIALFLHISKSLRAIDLSGIPFPKRAHDYIPGNISRTATAGSTGTSASSGPNEQPVDLGELIALALTERFAADQLEELILSGCGLATSNVAEIIDCAIKCKIRRLGLANNSLSQEALTHVVRYIQSNICEGLDLGSNDLRGSGNMIVQGIRENNPLFAISLSDCNLTPNDLSVILYPLTKLKGLKFIDLSRNRALFSDPNNAVSIFRRVLPKFQTLKRIHLCDLGMTTEHAIGLAEIFPDCETLCHISILDNAPLINVMNSTQSALQEEACALFVSLMTAVRASQSIIAIEIEVPVSESSEVVKALASQVVAYSLRNMEHGALGEAGALTTNVMPDKEAPEVLLHLVGHMEGYLENHDNDDPAPDDDYVIASGGIVKALGVCLGSQDHSSRTASQSHTPTTSGPATPRQGPLRSGVPRKPKDVSLELCESARKIRARLRPALIREDRAGNAAEYRRLISLDGTLERIIRRFEEEYPETKIPSLPSSPPTTNGVGSPGSSLADASVLSASIDFNGLWKVPSLDEYVDETSMESGNPPVFRLERAPSIPSLAAKALNNEEGRMLRFGQSLRRDLLKPTGTDDYEHGTSEQDPPESDHLAALRSKLESYTGDEIREKVEADGADSIIRDLGITLQELKAMQQEDPEAYKELQESQLAAQINAGIGAAGVTKS